ncbi:MAG: metalloregulator ArsR/SmtB family transcription factor [Gammaproteobacteria bacterium]|nr:metalloregulator ArsR/SmtB family transcription factor [Gammaproteobacteria bacterium]MCP4089552.1 metalloregulator ArsR/SmtB family transcription factor [Gammaproteobacteria bacterium]MCP4278113.1 metalloregulator ArsR/SmtB family transcription factor [Gammaproteobacteria bacterium]MCP4832443.1 metalloregulator ArsR/SmtB family transcription factor [Gammaproteobacteria bacterium]MCP4930080.1 metalloregulator ArsR/SmtB family transcription factor [Gammaproteobacteria bacterium]
MNLEYSVNSLKAASDATRLRLLALLAAGEATVGELQEVLEQSQPRVSRHLRILCEGGLADRFRDGHSIYYRVPSDPSARAFISVLLGRMAAEEPTITADSSKMADIRRTRARSAWSDKEVLLASGRSQIPGLVAEDDLAVALAEIPGELGDLLDIGSGTGAVLCHLAGRAREATGVDISPAMRVVARTRIREAGVSNCTLRQGDMFALPFEADSFDTVLLDQVLTLAEKPRDALKEASRVLRPAGRLLVLDRFGPVRASLEQSHGLSGLAENQLAVMLAEVGLRSSPRRDLAGRLPGFALLAALPAIEFRAGTYD